MEKQPRLRPFESANLGTLGHNMELYRRRLGQLSLFGPDNRPSQPTAAEKEEDIGVTGKVYETGDGVKVRNYAILADPPEDGWILPPDTKHE